MDRLLRNAIDEWVREAALDRHFHVGPPPEHDALRERFTGFRATPIFDALLADASPAVRLGLEATGWDRPRLRKVLVPEGIPDVPKAIFGVPVQTSPLVPEGKAYLLGPGHVRRPVTPEGL